MSAIILDTDQQVGWDVLASELRALASGEYRGRGDDGMPLGLPTALRYIADQIDLQYVMPKEFSK